MPRAKLQLSLKRNVTSDGL